MPRIRVRTEVCESSVVIFERYRSSARQIGGCHSCFPCLCPLSALKLPGGRWLADGCLGACRCAAATWSGGRHVAPARPNRVVVVGGHGSSRPAGPGGGLLRRRIARRALPARFTRLRDRVSPPRLGLPVPAQHPAEPDRGAARRPGARAWRRGGMVPAGHGGGTRRWRGPGAVRGRDRRASRLRGGLRRHPQRGQGLPRRPVPRCPQPGLGHARRPDLDGLPMDDAYGDLSPQGMLLIFPFRDGSCRVVLYDYAWAGAPVTEPVTLAEMTSSLAR